MNSVAFLLLLSKAERPDTGEAHVFLTEQPQPCALPSLLLGSSPTLSFLTPLTQLVPFFYFKAEGGACCPAFIFFCDLPYQNICKALTNSTPWAVVKRLHHLTPFPAVLMGSDTHSWVSASVWGSSQWGSVSLDHNCPFAWGWGSFFGFVGGFCEVKAHSVFSLKKSLYPLVVLWREKGIFGEVCLWHFLEEKSPFCTDQVWHCASSQEGSPRQCQVTAITKVTAVQFWPPRKMWMFLFHSQGGKLPAAVFGNSAGNLLFVGALASSESMRKMLWASRNECLQLMGLAWISPSCSTKPANGCAMS